ncbi:dna polymerase epsilon subunit b [Holotrichia oblita]|uniref:Dna polymerase epsilon subunit b n=1 Tax=Holotrichia oblita TaxID=644536 RepID=A0ACB9TQR9_HOLOL|nr:dna polymerase epsilon subunit b [Holotrichia oblita]
MADKLIRKLQNTLKLSGFTVRREFCILIYETFLSEGVNLGDNDSFENCIKNLCERLEKQCVSDRSIEKDDIKRAIEASLRSGYDVHETILSTINAFDYPKMVYDVDRKLYILAHKKSTLLSDADSKAQLFIDRYISILHRTQRNFKNKLADHDKLTLQTVDFLLTLSYKTLDRILILGSLLQVTEGKYYLEDPTGMVQLDLTHAKYHGGFFTENCFVLVNGYYEDKILRVSTMVLPPGEEYKDSRPFFGNINYFGGLSNTPLRESQRLKEHLIRNPHNMMLFFSDLWLDHPLVFEKLEVLFNGMQGSPPVAFIFMGNFMSESHGSENMEILKKLFKQFGELISRYTILMSNSQFIFVPGMSDPCTPHIVPRLSLPKYVIEEMLKYVPNAIFPTNPCRLQYCTKEIVLFRADILAKLMQGTLHRPQKEEIGDSVTRTIVTQGHLSPMPLAALTVHWNFDYSLRLYPLPNLVVLGDKAESYQGSYKGCQVINPVSRCRNCTSCVCKVKECRRIA